MKLFHFISFFFFFSSFFGFHHCFYHCFFQWLQLTAKVSVFGRFLAVVTADVVQTLNYQHDHHYLKKFLYIQEIHDRLLRQFESRLTFLKLIKESQTAAVCPRPLLTNLTAVYCCYFHHDVSWRKRNLNWPLSHVFVYFSSFFGAFAVPAVFAVYALFAFVFVDVFAVLVCETFSCCRFSASAVFSAFRPFALLGKNGPFLDCILVNMDPKRCFLGLTKMAKMMVYVLLSLLFLLLLLLTLSLLLVHIFWQQKKCQWLHCVLPENVWLHSEMMSHFGNQLLRANLKLQKNVSLKTKHIRTYAQMCRRAQKAGAKWCARQYRTRK